MTYNNNCQICGHPLPDTTGKRGRPAMYHPNCRKIESVFSWLEDLIMKINPTPDKKKELRARLWTLANLFNRKT